MTRSTQLLAGGKPTAGGAAAAGGWSPAGDLPSARQWFSAGESAVPLNDGSVLAAGGAVLRGKATDESLLFDPAAGEWTQTGKLTTGRLSHTLTKLDDGRVLAVGGMPETNRSPFTFLRTAEIYDPGERTWTPVAEMGTARSLHSATLLADGRVLVTGGTGYQKPGVLRTFRTAELYDPVKNIWTDVAPMTDARLAHPAIRLPDGRVLAVGGETGIDQYRGIGQSFCELYDPVAGRWTPTGSMHVPRRNHQAVLLPDGSVFVAGGDGPGIITERRLAPHSQWRTERYDPATGFWSPGRNMPTGRTFHRMVALPAGKVLVVGGTDAATYDVGYANAAVYDPLAQTWAPTGGMTTGRFYCSATALADGRVLAAGGTVRAGSANPARGQDLLTATTEIFTL
ncbi:Kelch repeat-containing protein [Actinomadura sp. 9N215]|uniref:Kelch repeat-containing protein n=1 Tax=Actinomadura sp. 9N215 TaxID=3375150 RepID=UPI00378A0B18